MRPFIPAFAFLILLTLETPTRALIFGNDNRILVATDAGTLFSPVGIIYGAAKGEYATAFLIDDCHALTVQHVFGESEPAKGRRTLVAFNVGGPPDSWTTSRAKVIAEGGVEKDRALGISGRVNDWTLLRLSKCLGKTFGHVQLSRELPALPDTIGIAGYPGDRPLSEGLSVDLGCHVRRVRSLTVLHDCAALPGNSGSPLFRIVGEGKSKSLEVFAMSEAAHSVDDLGRNAIDARENYPDAIWNVATALCDNIPLAAAGLACPAAELIQKEQRAS